MSNSFRKGVQRSAIAKGYRLFRAGETLVCPNCYMPLYVLSRDLRSEENITADLFLPVPPQPYCTDLDERDPALGITSEDVEAGHGVPPVCNGCDVSGWYSLFLTEGAARLKYVRGLTGKVRP